VVPSTAAALRLGMFVVSDVSFFEKNIWVICDHECIIAPIGLSRFSQNLDLLVPVFDGPLLELENIEHQQKSMDIKQMMFLSPSYTLAYLSNIVSCNNCLKSTCYMPQNLTLGEDENFLLIQLIHL